MGLLALFLDGVNSLKKAWTQGNSANYDGSAQQMVNTVKLVRTSRSLTGIFAVVMLTTRFVFVLFLECQRLFPSAGGRDLQRLDYTVELYRTALRRVRRAFLGIVVCEQRQRKPIGSIGEALERYTLGIALNVVFLD